ncbi:MAG: hypothetical protein AAF437_02350 [Pseudomonadota bacterium]
MFEQRPYQTQAAGIAKIDEHSQAIFSNTRIMMLQSRARMLNGKRWRREPGPTHDLPHSEIYVVPQPEYKNAKQDGDIKPRQLGFLFQILQHPASVAAVIKSPRDLAAIQRTL